MDDKNEMVYGVMQISFEELIEALKESGAEVESGIVFDGKFLKHDND